MNVRIRPSLLSLSPRQPSISTNIAQRIPRAPFNWLSSNDARPGDAPLHGRSELKDRILSVFRQATASTTVRLHRQAHSSNENNVSGPSWQVDYVPTSEDDP